MARCAHGARRRKEEKAAQARINRLCNSIYAALTLAADRDKRITNRAAWEKGLAGIPDAQRARNEAAEVPAAVAWEGR
jgi:hypothetical protein